MDYKMYAPDGRLLRAHGVLPCLSCPCCALDGIGVHGHGGLPLLLCQQRRHTIHGPMGHGPASRTERASHTVLPWCAYPTKRSGVSLLTRKKAYGTRRHLPRAREAGESWNDTTTPTRPVAAQSARVELESLIDSQRAVNRYPDPPISPLPGSGAQVRGAT